MQSDQQPTFRTHLLIALLLVIFPVISRAEQPQLTTGPSGVWLFFFFFIAILLLAIASWLKNETKKAMRFRQQNQPDQSSRYANWLHQFDSRQLSQLLSWRQKKKQSDVHNNTSSKIFLLLLLLVANQNSNEIVIFKRDKQTGLLEDTGKRIHISKPVCLKWMNVE